MDEYNVEAAMVVHDLEIIAALVTAGMGDCYLVKDDAGHLIGVFRDSPELNHTVQQLRDNSLTLNVRDYWEAVFQAETAQSDQWAYETADRQ